MNKNNITMTKLDVHGQNKIQKQRIKTRMTHVSNPMYWDKSIVQFMYMKIVQKD